MKVLYVSSMLDTATYKSLFVKDKKPMHAANKFNTLLCEGFVQNGIKVTSYSALPVNRENCDRKWIRVKKKVLNGYVQKYPSFINFPILRHLKLFMAGFLKGVFSTRKTVVIYDALVVSLAYGAVLGAKLTGKKRVAIVTDFPEHLDSYPRRNKVFHKLLAKSNGYILLTEQMNGVVNPKNKPYVIVEGLVDKAMQDACHKPFNDNNKQVLYAGTLLKKYGIKNLCESFKKVCKDGEELHVYGDGDYVPELLDLVKENKNIVYHGNKPNIDVVIHELDSALLVNPRPNEGEYTKYSFPSKTLEYMVSGTPVLSAKLDGISNEYDEYLYYFDSSDDNGLAVKLREILDKPVLELESFGKKAKDFAVNYKNNQAQAKKIVDFISSL
ncbi:MAG: glycosyltransferase [Clostridia bacterium]|nr:glycosyltransferase [Clostridia bacterium]